MRVQRVSRRNDQSSSASSMRVMACTRSLELARVVASAHQGAVTQMIGGDWSQARKHSSLSEKYAAVGVGIHAYSALVNQPMRLP
jgi:hypothetical protein